MKRGKEKRREERTDLFLCTVYNMARHERAEAKVIFSAFLVIFVRIVYGTRHDRTRRDRTGRDGDGLPQLLLDYR